MPGIDEYTVSLLHMNGADGSVVFDESSVFIPYNFDGRAIGFDRKLVFGSGDQDNVILALGAGGTWDSTRIHMPCVVEKDGTVYLFYAGYDGTTWKIGVATAPTSGFNGKGFTKSGNNPILTIGSPGAWDEKWVVYPFVIYDVDAGIWKMWYSGYNDAGTYAIGYATSDYPDSGWIKSGSNPILSPTEGWETTGIRNQSVLRENSSTYKMLYSGGSAAIGLATSSNGVDWVKEGSNPVLSATGSGWEALLVFSPRSLNKVDGKYHLLYVGKPTTGGQYSKIGYAHSADLISWTRGKVNPVLGPTKTWESYETENPFIVKIGGVFYVYYDCWYGTPQTIGGAILKTRVWTAAGNAQIDTDQFVFGGASGLFDGAADKVSAPGSGDFNFANFDFTIDLRTRIHAFPADGTIMDFLDNGAPATVPFGGWEFGIRNYAGEIRFWLCFFDSAGTVLEAENQAPGVAFALDTWPHLAVIRSGNNIYFAKDGVLGEALVFTATQVDNKNTLLIGDSAAVNRADYNGWIDELRISRGIARWTANFTPPTEEYKEEEEPPPSGTSFVVWIS